MKIINIKTLGLAVVAGLSIMSCSDCKDLDAGAEYQPSYENQGAPSITAVYMLSDDSLKKDTADLRVAIDSASLNDYIHIEGQNLANIKSMNLNGLDVDVKSRVYSTTTDAYVRIPRYIPQEETGLMTLETDMGSTSRPFKVAIPKVQLDGLMNEFALPGSRVQLAGDYFDLYNFGDTTETQTVFVRLINESEGYDEKCKVDSCTEEYTSIRIPKDAPDNSIVQITYNAMDGSPVVVKMPYRETANVMIDFRDRSANNLGSWDGNTKYLTDGSAKGDPENLGFDMWRFTNCDLAAWDYYGVGWWNKGRAQYIDVKANPQDYYFVFEVCTAASTPFYDYGDNGKHGAQNGGYSFNISGKNNTQWDPVTDGLKNTGGKWRTVRIPCDEIGAENLSGLTNSSDEGSNFAFICQPNTVAWTSVDHSFANFRFEKKNY